MAIDITMYVEVLNQHSDEWELIGNQFEDPYYDPKRNTTVDENGYEENARFTDKPYTSRNYTLFAILGRVDVDADEDEDNAPIPISKPRGLPCDNSKQLRKKIYTPMIEHDDYYGLSNLYLEELLNYNWEPYKEEVSDFLLETIPTLQKLGSPQNVRIIFMFD